MVNLISHLTTDKDEQQELWVRYLEDSDETVLSEHLAQIRKQYSEEQLLQVTVWHYLENPSDFNLQWLFDHFTDLEQSVIQLLILGVELNTIGCIKSIGISRLRHVVSIIRENKAWEELNGAQNQLNG